MSALEDNLERLRGKVDAHMERLLILRSTPVNATWSAKDDSDHELISDAAFDRPAMPFQPTPEPMVAAGPNVTDSRHGISNEPLVPRRIFARLLAKFGFHRR